MENRSGTEENNMLFFEPSFFETEEREGFVVNSIMKSVWASKMDMLNEIILLCEKHDIQYYADWGTLLGTIRHRGFIPWDDDIDIAMLRKDYNLFIQVSTELPAPLFLKYYNDEAIDSHAVIWNATSISTDEERLKRFYGCPYILGIDVFPLDYVPKNKEDAELQEEVYKIVVEATILLKKQENDADEIERMLCNIEDICKIKIDRDRNILSQLYQLLDLICQMYGQEESEELTQWYLSFRDRKFRLKKKWYDNPVKKPFEQMQLYVPGEYDKVLHEMYGDYQKRVKFSSDHIYPCYKEQEEMLNSYMKRENEK